MANNKIHTIVFRADGSPHIGMGHFVRTLSLASMLQDQGFRLVFATVEPSASMRTDVMAVCDQIWELSPETHFDDFFALLAPHHTVVLDNYFFDTGYQQRIVDLGCRLICIDDMREKNYLAHVVINHAIGFTRSDFSLEPYAELCTGTHWAMLRKEFIPNKLRVAVCFGGVDKYDLAGQVHKSLPHCDVHIIRGMSAKDVASQYLAADVAVVSASTTMLEALAIGVPVIAGYYVDNQEDIYKKAHAKGIIDGVGNWLDTQAMERLQHHIDRIRNSRPGVGAKERYGNLFARRISIRRVDSSDCRRIFDWANDPITRTMSFNSEPIAWTTHCLWFDRKLSDPNCYFYIGYLRENAIGQVRIDCNADSAEALLGISLDTTARGLGLGSELLAASTDLFFDEYRTANCINAYVKEDNKPSERMFIGCGFSEVGRKDGIIHFTLKRR